MALRDWQAQCIQKAVAQYSSGVRHFFCQATPGAGKTRMSAELAKQLFDQNQIDAVVCLAPSCQVVEGFQLTFTQVLNKAFDGRCSGSIIPDTQIGGNLAAKEVFNEKTTSFLHSRVQTRSSLPGP